MPPLNELLTQDQIVTLMQGNSEQLTEFLSFLDPAKRQQVVRRFLRRSSRSFRSCEGWDCAPGSRNRWSAAI